MTTQKSTVFTARKETDGSWTVLRNGRRWAVDCSEAW